MGKKFEDDSELKKLLEEQMIREAEIIEEAIFSDKDFEDYEMTDEEVEASYQKLMEQINASAEDPAPSAAEEKNNPPVPQKDDPPHRRKTPRNPSCRNRRCLHSRRLRRQYDKRGESAVCGG